MAKVKILHPEQLKSKSRISIEVKEMKPRVGQYFFEPDKNYDADGGD